MCFAKSKQFFVFSRYNRVVEGLRCVPSSINQQPGNLIKQKSPFPADKPIRTQGKKTIRKQDTKRNNQSTAETHTSFNMSRKSKSKDHIKALNIPLTLTQGDLLQEALAVTFAKDQTQALNIPVKVPLGGGRYAERTDWNGSKRVDLRFWKTDTIPTKVGVSLSLPQLKVLYSAMQVVDDLNSWLKDREPVDWRYDLGEDVYVIIKAPQARIHIRKCLLENGHCILRREE
jgi:hypothetical protein